MARVVFELDTEGSKVGKSSYQFERRLKSLKQSVMNHFNLTIQFLS